MVFGGTLELWGYMPDEYTSRSNNWLCFFLLLGVWECRRILQLLKAFSRKCWEKGRGTERESIPQQFKSNFHFLRQSYFESFIIIFPLKQRLFDSGRLLEPKKVKRTWKLYSCCNFRWIWCWQKSFKTHTRFMLEAAAAARERETASSSGSEKLGPCHISRAFAEVGPADVPRP